MIGGLARRPGTPQLFRVLLIGFAVRNAISVGVLGYLSYLAYVAGGRMQFLMAGIWIVFTGFAVYQGRKILGQYRRSVQREAQRAGDAGGGQR